mgnify:CR=1 FL=1
MLVVLLAFAQLGGILHAAEHGPGEHSRGGIECMHAATNDDNDAAPPPCLVHVAVSRVSSESSTLTGTARVTADLPTPRATGPPVRS